MTTPPTTMDAAPAALATQFGTLEDVPVRLGWGHEALNFTPWLAANLDRLSRAINVPLSLVKVEERVGRYAADILASDPNGRRVLIENQLGVSDHGHLGQILTYLTGLKAEIIVWVAPDFRDEHLSAVHWLNENTKDPFAFFAVQLRLVRIGDSLMAPLFDVLAKPNQWDRRVEEIARSASESGPRAELQRAFWELYRESYPAAADDSNPAGGRALWRAVPEVDLVVSRWFSFDGVGVFIRGGRGVRMHEVTDHLAPHEGQLQALLGGDLSNVGFPMLSRIDLDMTNQENWPTAASWLNEQAEAYAGALVKVLGDSRFSARQIEPEAP